MSDEGDRGTVDRLLDEAESHLTGADDVDELAESDEFRTLAEDAAAFVAERETIDLLDAVGVDVPEDAGPADVPDAFARADAATIARLRRLQKIAGVADEEEDTTVEDVAGAFGVVADEDATDKPNDEGAADDEEAADDEPVDEAETADEAEGDSLVDLVASAIGDIGDDEDAADETGDESEAEAETEEAEGIVETVTSKAEEAADVVRGDESEGEIEDSDEDEAEAETDEDEGIVETVTSKAEEAADAVRGDEAGDSDDRGSDRQGPTGSGRRLSTTYSTIPASNRPDMRGLARPSTIPGKQSRRRSGGVSRKDEDRDADNEGENREGGEDPERGENEGITKDDEDE